jgi:putative salt-induced outer membrane protein
LRAGAIKNGLPQEHVPMHRRIPAGLTALGLLAWGAPAQADVKPDGRWRGNGGAALAATSGNNETSSALLSFELVRATLIDKINLGGNLNHGRSRVDGERKTTADKWNLNGQYDYNVTPQLYSFAKLGLESDKVADLRLRTTVAAGSGYKLVDTPENSFSLLGGAARSIDRYRVPVTIDGLTSQRFARTSLFVGEESQHQLTASTTFKQRLEYYPGLSGDRAKLVKLSSGLGVAINATINLTVGLTDTYNSNPPDGQKRNDVGLFTGINVKLGAH